LTGIKDLSAVKSSIDSPVSRRWNMIGNKNSQPKGFIYEQFAYYPN
jgi:hypothetical protein